MSSLRSRWHSRITNRVFPCIGATFLSIAMCAQGPQTRVGEPANSIKRVKSGDYDLAHIETIAAAGAVEALPVLEEQFRLTADSGKRDKLANALVRLGDKDDTYWKYLLDQATLAADSDAPDPIFDSKGGVVNFKLSPEHKAWAESHNMSADSEGVYAMYELPGRVLLLAQTGDRRGIPFLRAALRSHNSMVVNYAARGLAKIGDQASIPFLLAACRRGRAGLASIIAGSLVYFDDPRAQTAVDLYMRKQDAKLAREARAHGLGPFGFDR